MRLNMPRPVGQSQRADVTWRNGDLTLRALIPPSGLTGSGKRICGAYRGDCRKALGEVGARSAGQQHRSG
jgi:hypothetical protein